MARENREPRGNPEEGCKTQKEKSSSPSQVNQKPRDQDAFQDESGSSSEVKESRGQTTLLCSEQQADDLRSARQVNRFSDSKENSEPHQPSKAARKSGKALRERPYGECPRIEPEQIESVSAPANRNLHEGVRPEERRQKQAFAFRREPEVSGDERERKRNGGAIEVVDQRREEKKPHN